MATAPTQDEINQVLEQNMQEHQAKLEAQRAEGKAFDVPADGHGPGVVPEETWQAGKAQPEGGTQ